MGDALTSREQRSSRSSARGRRTGRSRGELFVSEATVKTHLVHVYSKLGVADRAAAVASAYQQGILG